MAVSAGAQADLDLDRRVAAAVEDLAGVDALDLRSSELAATSWSWWWRGVVVVCAGVRLRRRCAFGGGSSVPCTPCSPAPCSRWRHSVLAFPLFAEFFDELAQRLSAAAVAVSCCLIDASTCASVCCVPGGGAGDFVDVVAEGRLHGPAEHALLGGEDRFVQRLLLLALDHARAVRRRWPCSSGRSTCSWRRVRSSCPIRFPSWPAWPAASVLVRIDPHVALFGRAELGLVFVVVLFDFRLADGALSPWRSSAGFSGQQVQLHAQQQIRDRLARAREEFFEFGGLGELLVLDFFELLLDFRVAHLHAQRFGFAEHPVRGDQEAEHLLLQRFVLLFALALQLRRGAAWTGPWPVSASSLPGARCRPCSRAGRGPPAWPPVVPSRRSRRRRPPASVRRSSW